MKRLFRIFEVSKSEQRVVLIVMIVLITIAFIGYERRIHHRQAEPISPTAAKPAPTVQSSFKPGIRP
jgi:hypothetical protein